MEQEFKLDEVAAKDIAAHKHTEKQFTTLLTQLHGVSAELASGIYAREKGYYEKALREPQGKLPSCTKISLFSAFVEIAISNVSIQSGAKSEAYFTTRSTKSIEQKDGRSIERWTASCMLTLTAFGELALRIRAGHLLRMSNPIVIYEGDTFQPHTNDNGDLVISYALKVPRTSTKIIGCWVTLILPHGMKDHKWMLQDDIDRLQEASGKQVRDAQKTNKEKANALYTSNGGQIDVGFLETKCIKHAMKTLPKLRMGSSIITETEVDYENVVEAAPVGASYAQPTGTPIEKAQASEVVITATDESW